tara:strand:- start:5269 stop:6108 length:840 start_codon:yes stop_codon:yes gene_type:complete
MSTVNNKKKSNNWGKLAKGCFYDIIYVLLFSLIGANFIYFSSMNRPLMELFFPSNEYYYYENPVQTINSKLSKIGIPPTGGWPYNMKTDDIIDFSVDGVKNLTAVSVAKTYSKMRGILIYILDFFSNKDKSIFSGNTVQMISANVIFMLSIMTMPLLPIIIFICFFIFSCTTAYANDLILFAVTLCCFCFGPSMWIGTAVSGIMTMQFFATYLIIPLYNDHNAVKNIIYKSANMLKIILAILFLFSVRKHLDEKYAIGSTIAFFLLILKKYYDKNRIQR